MRVEEVWREVHSDPQQARPHVSHRAMPCDGVAEIESQKEKAMNRKVEERNEFELQRLILDYEVRSSLLSTKLPFRWMRAILAVFITAKAKRKYARWMLSLKIQQAVEKHKEKEQP